uniref:E3 SUMO-protein ligase NSE2 n=1 Tax=Sphenodon punctatus TaxID=8508 RepID=A0A8D0HFQ7_SPHPU
MPGGSVIPFNIIESSLSSLKSCQSYINVGMDLATNVALDLVESSSKTAGVIKQDKPETIPDLKVLVKEKLVALESRNSESELLRNEKFVHFKEQLQKMKTQCKPLFFKNDKPVQCPSPWVLRNKTCGHTYEEEAILKLIQHKEKRQKKACCPKVGCNNLDVKRSDLVPDEALKRAIESQNK